MADINRIKMFLLSSNKDKLKLKNSYHLDKLNQIQTYPSLAIYIYTYPRTFKFSTRIPIIVSFRNETKKQDPIPGALIARRAVERFQLFPPLIPPALLYSRLSLS